jgi:quinol monooxygenase YgiN
MTVNWRIPAGEARPLAASLQTLMVSTRNQPGCTGCSLSTEMSTQAAVRYVEEWSTEDDLRQQIRSERFAALAELLEHSSEQPTVEFTLASTCRGLDYAHEVRQASQ